MRRHRGACGLPRAESGGWCNIRYSSVVRRLGLKTCRLWPGIRPRDPDHGKIIYIYAKRKALNDISGSGLTACPNLTARRPRAPEGAWPRTGQAWWSNRSRQNVCPSLATIRGW